MVLFFVTVEDDGECKSGDRGACWLVSSRTSCVRGTCVRHSGFSFFFFFRGGGGRLTRLYRPP